MADLRGGNELAARRRLGEVLAAVPGTAVVFAPLLQIAPRHVEADGVSEDVIVGALYIDAAAAFVKRNPQLGLVVVVGRLRRIVNLAATDDEREFGLQEKERRLAAIAA